jgi:hypothetical protein
VHRLREVTGTEGTPLNELELGRRCADGQRGLPASTVMRHRPEQAVPGLEVGGPVRLSVEDAERPALAALDQVETKSAG